MSIRDSIIKILKDEILDALLESELCDEKLANEITRNAFKGIQNRLGGCKVYVPKNKETDYDYAEIRAAFDGRNHAEVCRRFGISLKTFYRAIE